MSMELKTQQPNYKTQESLISRTQMTRNTENKWPNWKGGYGSESEFSKGEIKNDQETF